MEPAPPETKRPRLTTDNAQWSGLPLPNPTSFPPPQQHYSRPPEPLPSPHHHIHDRHQHDQDVAYPPMHDPHRQPPPSPAHGPGHRPYLPFPREPTVKRDPADESSLPHLRRPNSTGAPNDGASIHHNVPPPPSGHPGAPHTADDPRRPMSFDNGMAHSPSVFRQPAPHFSQPAPVSHHGPYEASPSGYAPPTPTASMFPIDIQTAGSNSKRKAQRASQACDSCRQLKAKCDETKPCKNCREKNVNCVYREPVAKQPDKVSSDILEAMLSLKDEMTSLSSALNSRMDASMLQMEASMLQLEKRLDRRLTSVETSIKHANPAQGALKIESIEDDQAKAEQTVYDPQVANEHHTAFQQPGELPMSPSPPFSTPYNTQDALREESPRSKGKVEHIRHFDPNSLTTDQAQETLRRHFEDDRRMLEEPPGPPVQPGKPKLSTNHTTLAGLLLTWPSIKPMVQHHLEAAKIRFPEEFPIRQEQQRGLIRVHGCGEGFDQDIRAAEYSAQMDQLMPDANDDFSDIASPAPPGEVWGQVGGMSPPPNMKVQGGVLSLEGNPDYTPELVWKYVQSFKDNILTLHPIIVLKELDAMVKLFLDALPQKTQQNQRAPSFTKWANQPSSATPTLPEPTGSKRKRSPGAEDSPSSSNSFQKMGRPYRSIHSALVLLVLALGKLCLHKEPIPDVIHDAPEAPIHGSPSIRNGVPPSPLQGSPPGFFSQSHSSGLPSPQDNERPSMSRRPSLPSSANHSRVPQLRKNYEVIPGLEYFALATDIIGSHLGGFNLKHVYVFIFAGLYHGQLGRVLESWAYINKASQTLQVIMRPSLSRLSKNGPIPKTARRDNQMLFAFWTCLQLESDIIAELPLAPSPIFEHEDSMPYPSIEFCIECGFDQAIAGSYFAQLHLRKKLNDIHSMLYIPKHRGSERLIDSPITRENIDIIQMQLQDALHIWVPAGYSWNIDDPPARDLLSARLRAKYWGSQNIINRPYIKNIIDGEAPVPYKEPPPPPEEWLKLFGVTPDMVPQDVDVRTFKHAWAGVRALIESTQAFHGLPRDERIIITNPFGTAHAQWGNLLTLSACYKNKCLSRYIPTHVLRGLFVRTIEWFRGISPPSSPLYTDLKILIGLATDLQLIAPNGMDYQMEASFSSATSNGTAVPGVPSAMVPTHPSFAPGPPPPPGLGAPHPRPGPPPPPGP